MGQMIKNCSKNDSRQQKSLVHDTHSTENCVACDSALLKEIMELLVAEMKKYEGTEIKCEQRVSFYFSYAKFLISLGI